MALTPRRSRQVVATATATVAVISAPTLAGTAAATAVIAAPVMPTNGVFPAGARAIEYDLAASS